MADSLILMVMALVVFGPRRLPQIGRQIGKLMYEFRKASNDFKFQMEEELRNSEEADRRKKEEERLRALALAAPAPAQVEASTIPETTATDTAGTTAASAEIQYPPTIYDNGPVASTQVGETHTADTSPIFRQPSIGDTVAAARGWSNRYEEARLAEASKTVGGPVARAEESEVTRVVEPGTTPPFPARIEPELPHSATPAPTQGEFAESENAPSEPGSAEPSTPAAAHDGGIAVNHHG
jgi:Sec-independent protein translocase protein TatA